MPILAIPTSSTPSDGLPEGLSDLRVLALNLRWTWRKQTQDLLERIDPIAWAHNVSPIQSIRLRRNWKELLEDQEFLGALRAEKANLDGYLAASASGTYEGLGRPVAYFCAEYAFHTSMNQYAGGLGILAGDHCKEASDLNLPFVAIGLYYSRGFFHQSIDWSGRQEAIYPQYRPEALPLLPVIEQGSDERLIVSLPLPGRDVQVQAWLVQVGRTPLLLLDTDRPDNRPEDRKITSQLYTNSREMRLYQEFVLGVGGVKLLESLKISPGCFHLNEGHSALLLLERIRSSVTTGTGYKQASEEVKRSSVLTIHTPVPEGNERFPVDLTGTVLKPYLDASTLTMKKVLADGLGKDEDWNVFDMTAFALRHTSHANGVSLLHGRTADKTWRAVTKKPVIGITNGIHMPTWLGPEVKALLEAIGASFDPKTDVQIADVERPDWQWALSLNSHELWHAHLAQKRRLIGWARTRLFEERARHGEGPSHLSLFEDALDPDALLIGFARRFATYKRAALLFSDLKRVLRLFENTNRKVQILFAGKSHPSDRSGQELVEEVFRLSQSERFLGKVFLLEDYDMETGAMLVQGVDLWLNNPRRPLEASGTSGMKAAANGVPNLSILDGWWDEGYNSEFPNGWPIGKREEPTDWKVQDRRDAKALYRALEKEIIPLFFNRGGDGIPEQWTEVMKRSIASTLYSFSTVRMLRDYTREMYLPHSTN